MKRSALLDGKDHKSERIPSFQCKNEDPAQQKCRLLWEVATRQLVKVCFNASHPTPQG